MESVSTILECIRTVGRGERGRKPLTQEQAYRVMDEYLDGSIGDDQMAMLLMLIRVNNETPEEIAGFTQAFQKRMPVVNADIDWPCYAGKKSRLNESGHELALPWHLVAAKILAYNGYKVLLHGHLDEGSPRKHCNEYIDQLNITRASSIEGAQELLNAQSICYLPLTAISEQAVTMLNWKKRYGLRTPINTVVRGFNPGQAKYGIRGSFHPGYPELHASIEKEIGLHKACILSFKGVSGEAEYNPKVSQTVWRCRNDKLESEYWPALYNEDIVLPKRCPLGTVIEERVLMANHVYATLVSVLSTIETPIEMAEAQAKTMWIEYCNQA
jgi:anthranilate phosphoribosyltransferase